MRNSKEGPFDYRQTDTLWRFGNRYVWDYLSENLIGHLASFPLLDLNSSDIRLDVQVHG